MSLSPSGADPAEPFLDFRRAPEELPGWAIAACDALDLTVLRDLIVARCLAVFESEVTDEPFARNLALSVSENLDTLIGLICGRTDPTRLTLDRPMSFASLQAQVRVPQADLQRSYRVSFLTIWDEVSARVDAAGEAAGADPAERLAAVRLITRAILTYHDLVTSRAAENYSRVEETLGQSRARMRQQLIRELLQDGAAPLPAAELGLLEYDVGLTHLAVLLRDAPADVGDRVLRECRSRGIVREGLVYPRGLASTVVWLGAARPWDEASTAAVAETLGDLGCRAVVSEGHAGAAGLAASLREAEAVLDLVDGHPGLGIADVVRHGDVMLDLLLLRDAALAGEFVQRTLGQLAEDSPEAARLCDTVSAWMRLGSHVAAAEDLGVHEQTIRNRLARAEALMGGGLRSRRTEVEVALRVRRLLAQQGRPESAAR